MSTSAPLWTHWPVRDYLRRLFLRFSRHARSRLSTSAFGVCATFRAMFTNFSQLVGDGVTLFSSVSMLVVASLEDLAMPESDATKWPSVEVAYDFVLPSYALMASRFEAADARLTALLTFASAVTPGVPLFAKALHPAISFASPWFFLAMTAFLVSVSIVLIARVRGAIRLPDPMKIYNKGLRETEWSFKRNALYFAGQHFSANASAIRVKGTMAVGAAAGIILEILLFVLWIARAA